MFDEKSLKIPLHQRLGQIVIAAAGYQGIDHIVRGTAAGHHENRCPGITMLHLHLADDSEGFMAIHTGHEDIHTNQIKVAVRPESLFYQEGFYPVFAEIPTNVWEAAAS